MATVSHAQCLVVVGVVDLVYIYTLTGSTCTTLCPEPPSSLKLALSSFHQEVYTVLLACCFALQFLLLLCWLRFSSLFGLCAAKNKLLGAKHTLAVRYAQPLTCIPLSHLSLTCLPVSQFVTAHGTPMRNRRPMGQQLVPPHPPPRVVYPSV